MSITAFVVLCTAIWLQTYRDSSRAGWRKSRGSEISFEQSGRHWIPMNSDHESSGMLDQWKMSWIILLTHDWTKSIWSAEVMILDESQVILKKSRKTFLAWMPDQETAFKCHLFKLNHKQKRQDNNQRRWYYLEVDAMAELQLLPPSNVTICPVIHPDFDPLAMNMIISTMSSTFPALPIGCTAPLAA